MNISEKTFLTKEYFIARKKEEERLLGEHSKLPKDDMKLKVRNDLAKWNNDRFDKEFPDKEDEGVL